MEVICAAFCEDCATKTIVSNPNYATIFVGMDDEYSGVVICTFCERPIICNINDVVYNHMIDKGVRVFSWKSCTEVHK